MNKNILIILGLVVVIGVGGYFLISRNQRGGAPTQQPTSTASSQSLIPSSTATPTSKSKPIPKPVVKEFSITAKQFMFEPNTITVNRGDTVRLHVRTLDVTHGLSIPYFGVNAIIKIEQPATVEFVASKAGTYGMFCSEYCGAGHPNMKGTLIVK